MEFLQNILTSVGQWGGNLAKTIYEIFINLFCTYTTSGTGTLTYTVTGLNYFGIVFCVFAGFSIVVGLARLILKKFGY